MEELAVSSISMPVRTRSHTIRPIRLRMSTESNGDFLDLNALGNLQVQLTAENSRLLGARVAVIVTGEEEHRLSEGDSDRNTTTRGYCFLMRQWRKCF